MYIGSKIKEYRSQNKLTQKELADLLHVTYQAVSRWENDAVEPSFDCLMDMTKIFHCTMDDLFGMEKEQVTQHEAPKPEIQVVEKVQIKEPPKILAICDDCKKAIYDNDDLFRIQVDAPSGHSHPYHTHMDKINKVLCATCYNDFQKTEKQQESERQRASRTNLLTKRRHSFIWGSVAALSILSIGIFLLINGKTDSGLFLLGASVLTFTFIGCIFLNNNFIPDVWLEIVSWGFVKMPGVIFEFSLGGFLIGLAIKILLWIIGLFIAVLVTAGATALAMLLSIFVYPFALRKNINSVNETQKEA